MADKLTPIPDFGPPRKPTEKTLPDRLESWKEIAAYLNRTLRTVQRWEKSEGLPVHRHQHEERASVCAFKAEVDEWWKTRRVRLEREAKQLGIEEGQVSGKELQERRPIGKLAYLTDLKRLKRDADSARHLIPAAITPPPQAPTTSSSPAVKHNAHWRWLGLVVAGLVGFSRHGAVASLAPLHGISTVCGGSRPRSLDGR